MKKEKEYWNKELETLTLEERLSLCYSNPEDIFLPLQLFQYEQALALYVVRIFQRMELI